MADRLLLYLSHAGDPQRTAVGPALAAAAERGGWAFECYYGAPRQGRHFGGGDPDRARPGWPNGSLVAGGRHGEQAFRLACRYDVIALGDPECVLWPALDAAGAEVCARTLDPVELYEAAYERLALHLPERVLMVDARPQGPRGLVVAPYLYPAFLAGEPALGLEASADGELVGRLGRLGVGDLHGLYVGPGVAGELRSTDGEVGGSTYAELTSALARRYARWGRGVLLGDPDLVAAQLPRARRLRLLPLYGRPQVEAIEAGETAIRDGEEPVWGRQYDDRDFFALGRLGRSLQLVDPDPPFDSARENAPSVASTAGRGEPEDAELEAWASEGRVLSTLLIWSGMVRELDCVPRLIDLVAATELRAGLVLTATSLELGASLMAPLAFPVNRGGVLGLLEPLLASTGRGVSAETLMPDGVLRRTLSEARADASQRLPGHLAPTGWWPLLDAPLVPHRAWPIGVRAGRPVLQFRPRAASADESGASTRPGRDLRGLVGAAVRRSRLERLFAELRPFEGERPGQLDERVARAVRDAGFAYMWSKAGFGRPRILLRDGDFVALSLTAGNWDGWSPFYTVGSAQDLTRAEHRLLRAGRPGWLVGTIDAPLWALSGEILERGSDLLRIAKLVVRGGASGRLVNVTPNVIARYARILDEQGLVV